MQALDDYKNFVTKLPLLEESERNLICRYLARTDLFFLLWFVCGRKDLGHPWLLARCKEVEAEPDGCLDLWARGHYKSSIITFGKTMQDILASHGEDPLPHWNGMEPTFGIFSCTRPIAKGFLVQIKREFERNRLLYNLFPDVVWENCEKEAPKWSDDGGIILKRKGNPKESTVEAWGVVEGQPTSKHFTHIIFDDLVTIDNVRSPMMIEKTTEALSLADNLGSKNYKRRFIGTRYHFNDTYRFLIKHGNVHTRQHPATYDGTPQGEPVLLPRDVIEEKRRIQGPYVFSCQMLLNPIADETQSFKKEWLRWHGGVDNLSGNKYILVDPASEKKATSDYTAMCVIDLGADGNYKVADLIRDRLNLKERVDALFQLVKRWKPIRVGYEKYGIQADIEYIKERQKKENYFFDVVPLGGSLAKIDRIKRIIPSLSEGKWYFPDSVFKTNYEGKVQDLIDILINEEYLAFPVPVHDDILDCMSRIMDPDLSVVWPRSEENDDERRYTSKRRTGSIWSV